MNCPCCTNKNEPKKISFGGNFKCTVTTKYYICSNCGSDYQTETYNGKNAVKKERLCTKWR